MSATGLGVFDKTVQSTNIWLDEIMAALGPDRHLAWHALGAVLHAVRDRIPIGLAAHLGSQLPILIRGTYYDQWNPDVVPLRFRSADEFLSEVQKGLADARPVDAADAARAVLRTISSHIAEGQTRKVREALPEDVRALWPDNDLVEPVPVSVRQEIAKQARERERKTERERRPTRGRAKRVKRGAQAKSAS